MSTPSAILLLMFFALPSPSLEASSSPKDPSFSGGLVVELIYRDSPRSRSHNSVRESSVLPRDLAEPVINAYFEYLYFMRVSIGTPPVELTLLLDTGSDLTWTQCVPCDEVNCYPGPRFNPFESSTFAVYDCRSEACMEHSGSDTSCDPDVEVNPCEYSRRYGGGSSVGFLSSDTFTMTSVGGWPMAFPGVLFGCGHENRAEALHGFAGIAGLGGGSSSLISQLGMRMGSVRFSYCLTQPWGERRGDSRLYIGRSSVFLGNSTPLAVEPSEHDLVFYYLRLEDISVGAERLRIPPGTFDKAADNSGGIIIDSGTAYTELKREAFDMLVRELRKEIGLVPSERSDDELCYFGTREDLVEENIPIITFHFSGLDVPLRPWNSFKEAVTGDRIICLQMLPTDAMSVFGNYAQRDMNVGYDLDSEKLSIAPVDCSEY